MRIVGGDLIVYGTVNGVATLLGGDAHLKGRGILNGQIITIGGNVYREPNSTVNGKIIENNLKEGLIYRETDKEDAIQGTTEFGLDRHSDRSRQSWIHPKRPVFSTTAMKAWSLRHLMNAGIAVPNRISDLVGPPASAGEKGSPLIIQAGPHLKRAFLKTRIFILYASLFKETRTDDGYRLPQEENSWASFLARQDFYDRWDESGWEAGYGLNIFRNIRIKGRFVSAKQDSLPVWSMTSLFEKKRFLRPNLVLDPKLTNYYEMSLMARTPNYSPLQTGLAVFLQLEYIQS